MALLETEKTRVTVTITDDALAYIDEHCRKYGMSRGAFISYISLEKLKADNIANTMVEFQKQLQEYQTELINQGALIQEP